MSSSQISDGFAINSFGSSGSATLPGYAQTGLLSLFCVRCGGHLPQVVLGAFRAVHEIASGKRLGEGPPSSGWIYSLAFSRDGEKLLTGGPYATVTLCAVDAELSAVRRMEGHVGGIASVAFAGGDRRVVSAGGEGTVRLWDAATGAHLATAHFFEGGGWLVTTPDGRYDLGGGAERFCSLVGEGLAHEPLDPKGRTPGLFRSLLVE